MRSLPDPRAGVLSASEYWRRDLEAALSAVPHLTARKRHERAWTVFEDAVDEHLGSIRRMSLRHCAKITSSTTWYRLSTWNGVKGRQDMFHVPFGAARNSYRFSPPGKPALYLGNNVYTCWLECRAPALDECRISRFVHSFDQAEFLDLPVNHETYLGPLEFELIAARLRKDCSALNLQNSPYYEDVIEELAEYLCVWPLLAACAIQKHDNAAEPIEYLLPQFLMRWVEKRGWFGIRYFTTRYTARNAEQTPVELDRSNNSADVSINLVLPTRTAGKTQGYCDQLMERVHCTEPRCFADANAIPDAELFTATSADYREAAVGRYWVHWKGTLQHYQYTPFGRIEYLLDRLPVDRIDAAQPAVAADGASRRR